MSTDAEAQSVLSDDTGEQRPLKRLGKYAIERRLGAGGMGAVYLALDTELQRTVALKVLPTERADNPTLVRRFKAEGQAAARLEHENIVKVYEAGEIDRHLYLALEYVDGIDVQELVRKRTRLPVKRSIDIVRQVVLALKHAHAKNIVHRDIKPSNLLIRKDGVVKLADMGLARAIDDSTATSITRAGMTVGTVDYMAPEQAKDSKLADIRSDIYSLGCTWYHMLTGNPPFPDGGTVEKMNAHALAARPNPVQYNDRIPEAVVAVMHRMMARDPRDRYQTPNELLADLRQQMLSVTSVSADLLAGLAGEEEAVDHQPDGGPQARETTRGKAARNGSDRSEKTAEKRGRSTATSPRKTRPADAETQHKPRRRTKSRGKPDDAKARELPPRSENPEQIAVAGQKIDPELVKFVLFGLIGVVFLGAVGWAVVRMTSSDDDRGGGGFNPYQVDIDDGTGEASARRPATSPVAPSSDASESDDETDETESDAKDAEFVDYRNVSLFSGAERAEDVPAWLARVDAVSTADLQVVTIGEDVAESPEAIQAMLTSLPNEGAIVEFNGRGPFHVPSVSLGDRKHVVLRTAQGSSPVLVLHADDSHPVDSWLTSRGELLEVSGLHFVAGGRTLASGAALVDVKSGSLMMRETSLTMVGSAEPHAVAVRLGDGGSSANGLLENTLVRGGSLSAVRLASPGTQLVAGNSLIVAGDAPAFTIAPSGEPARGDGNGSEPVAVAAYSCIVVSERAAFGLVGENTGEVPEVQLQARRTVFARAGEDGVWMRIDGWPESTSGSLAASRARGVDWQSDESVILGWPTLIEFQPPGRDEPLSVVDEEGWRRFWNASPDSRQFVAQSVEFSQAAARTLPGEVVSDIQTSLAAAEGPGSALAFDAALLPRLPDSLIARVEADATRPRVPARFAVAGHTEVTFDLARAAMLDRFLNSSECPDGAVVRLTGSGNQIRPIVLKNKSLRLVFPEGEEAAALRPIPAPGDERPPALIRVEGGSIDLVNAHLTLPSSARANYPLRVLQVIDGSFTLEGCILEGQFRAGAEDVPVVEWVRTGGEDRQFAAIRNSYLSGRFQVLGADLARRLLSCENSILLGTGALLNLQNTRTENDAAGYVALSDCTLAAGGSAVVVRPASDASQENGAIHFFVERCVFAAPPDGTAAVPTVLTHPPSAVSAGTIVWWESHTGFAPQVRRFHQPLDAPAEGSQELQADWVRLWGPDHVHRPLSGPKAVLFARPLPDPDRTEPPDLALAEDCEAHRWAPGGAPIGADVATIGPRGSVAEQEQESPTRRPSRPSRTQPGF